MQKLSGEKEEKEKVGSRKAFGKSKKKVEVSTKFVS